MDRKKQLKEQYKLMKKDMGIFIVRCKINNKYYVETTKDLKGRLNSTKFKLNAGGHQNIELQKDWKKYGADCFEIEILEHLPYDKDESKQDYSEELSIMLMVWEEKLSQPNINNKY